MLLPRLLAAAVLLCAFVQGNNFEVLDQFQRDLTWLKTYNVPFMFKPSTVQHEGRVHVVPTIYVPSSVVQRSHHLQDPLPTIQDVEHRFGVKVWQFQNSHYVVTPEQYTLLINFRTYYHNHLGFREASIFDSTLKEWLDSSIFRRSGGQMRWLETPETAIGAIQNSERSEWHRLDDQGYRHLSWWNVEYRQARETVCRPPKGARRVVNMIGNTVQSLRGYRRIPEDCSGNSD